MAIVHTILSNVCFSLHLRRMCQQTLLYLVNPLPSAWLSPLFFPLKKIELTKVTAVSLISQKWLYSLPNTYSLVN